MAKPKASTDALGGLLPTHSTLTTDGNIHHHRNEDDMTELEALRHQVKQLEAQLIDEREQAYRSNLRDVELCQKAQADADRLRAALTSVCRSMAGECTPKRLLTAGDVCFHEAARALWPNA